MHLIRFKMEMGSTAELLVRLSGQISSGRPDHTPSSTTGALDGLRCLNSDLVTVTFSRLEWDLIPSSTISIGKMPEFGHGCNHL